MKLKTMVSAVVLGMALFIATSAIAQETINNPEKGLSNTDAVEAKSKEVTAAKGVMGDVKQSGLEIFISPNSVFYDDSLGFEAGIGVQSNLGWFGINNFAKDIVVGVGGLWHGVYENNNYGGFALVGYQVFLGSYIKGLPWYGNVRFIVEGRSGAVYQDISGDNADKSSGAAYYAAPALVADLRLPGFPVRLGLDVSYNYYINEKSLRSFSSGFYAAYIF